VQQWQTWGQTTPPAACAGSGANSSLRGLFLWDLDGTRPLRRVLHFIACLVAARALEEKGECREHTILNEIADSMKPRNLDLKLLSPDAIWFSKNDGCLLMLKLHIELVGKRNCHFKPKRRIPMIDNLKIRKMYGSQSGVHGDQNVLVDVAQFVKQPQWMFLERSPSLIKLE